MTMVAQDQRVTVGLLATCQALSMTGTSLLVTVAALTGDMLTTDKSLATLPVALQFVGTMSATIPASLLMARIGRRAGFSLGQVIGAIGAALSIYAIVIGSFWLLCGGAFLLGAHNAFWQYLRFAAADGATPEFRPKAISYVMVGGVLAAIAGPALSVLAKDALAPFNFAGSYAVIVVVCIMTIAVLQAVRIPKLTAEQRRDTGRPLSKIARQPAFVVAVISSGMGYGVMILVMTATPLAMIACGYTFEHSTMVIMSHAVGMFLPSFFTGHLINRFGVLRVIMTGAVLSACCMAIALAGIELANFWFALVILGVGWNFLFVGGTTLLTQSYTPSERAKTQAAHDFVVFTFATLASFSAGMLHAGSGWSAVNAAVAIPVLFAFSAALWLLMAERRRKSLI